MTEYELIEQNALRALLQIYKNTFEESDVPAEVIAEAKRHVHKMIDPGSETPKWLTFNGERRVLWVKP